MNPFQQIMDAIENRFSEISIANGYWTDAGDNVYVNKSNRLISNNDEQCINIVDLNVQTIGPKTGGMIQRFDHMMLIESTLHFSGGTAAATIRDGVADVIRAIGEDPSFGGLAINSYPPEGSEFFTFVFDQEEDVVIGARIYFVVEFRTTEWLINEHDLTPES